MIPCRSIHQVFIQTGQPQPRTLAPFCPAPGLRALIPPESDGGLC